MPGKNDILRISVVCETRKGRFSKTDTGSFMLAQGQTLYIGRASDSAFVVKTYPEAGNLLRVEGTHLLVTYSEKEKKLVISQAGSSRSLKDKKGNEVSGLSASIGSPLEFYLSCYSYADEYIKMVLGSEWIAQSPKSKFRIELKADERILRSTIKFELMEGKSVTIGKRQYNYPGVSNEHFTLTANNVYVTLTDISTNGIYEWSRLNGYKLINPDYKHISEGLPVTVYLPIGEESYLGVTITIKKS